MSNDLAGRQVEVADTVDVGPLLDAAQGCFEPRPMIIFEAQGSGVGHALDQVAVQPGNSLRGDTEGVIEVIAIILEQQ